jgi:hypothetical protein
MMRNWREEVLEAEDAMGLYETGLEFCDELDAVFVDIRALIGVLQKCKCRDCNAPAICGPNGSAVWCDLHRKFTPPISLDCNYAVELRQLQKRIGW